MNILNIAFDLDGTLLDSRYRHQKALHDCIIRFNPDVKIETLNDYIPFKQNGNNTPSYLEKKEISPAKDIYDCWLKMIEDEQYLDCDCLFPESISVLNFLSRKYNLYLVTGRKNIVAARKQLKLLELNNYFQEIFIAGSYDNLAEKKYQMTKHLDLFMIYGDSGIDYEWSRLASTKFVALNCGFRNKIWWLNRGIISYPNLELAIKDTLTF